MALRRIDEAVEHEMAEEDAPVAVEAGQQPLPVQHRSEPAQHVQDVRAVVALPLHDERLGP